MGRGIKQPSKAIGRERSMLSTPVHQASTIYGTPSKIDLCIGGDLSISLNLQILEESAKSFVTLPRRYHLQ